MHQPESPRLWLQVLPPRCLEFEYLHSLGSPQLDYLLYLLGQIVG